jgi:hypothetical protein
MQTALANIEANSNSDRSNPPVSGCSRGGLSDRPTCRIYAANGSWILQLDRGSAWLQGVIDLRTYRRFRTLAEAVRFADQNGFDYRIVKRRPLSISRFRHKAGGSEPRLFWP